MAINCYPDYRKANIDIKQSETGLGFSKFAINNTCGIAPVVPRRVNLDPYNTMPFSRSEQYLFKDKYADYKLSAAQKEPNGYIYREAIDKTLNNTPLSDLFFSKKNLDHLIDLACQTVTVASQGLYKISPESQNRTELLTVCRSMYLQLPTNPYAEDLRAELCKLNRAVLDWVVPKMLTNVQQYLGYVRDASHTLITIPRSQNVNVTGTKTDKFYNPFYF